MSRRGFLELGGAVALLGLGLVGCTNQGASSGSTQANDTQATIEVFDGLSHGFGLGTGTVAEGWIDRAADFWDKQS